MEWTDRVDAGDWVRAGLNDPWDGTVTDVVPRGFAAYARVFHPATRERPVGEDWPPLPQRRHRREWDAFFARDPEIDTQWVRWADTAAAFGTTMHAGAQWTSLVAPGVAPGADDGPRDADGRRYDDPSQGAMPAEVYAALASVLTAHTTTPDDGYVAIWEGWGGLVGGIGFGSGRESVASFASADDTRHPAVADIDPAARVHAAMLGASVRDPLNDGVRTPQWHRGILPDEVSRGARLRLPGRDHVLFRGGIAEFADADWELRMPWRDTAQEAYGFPPSAQTPQLVWPADRSWAMASEVDFDSTLVGGSPELVRALCTDPRLEALAIREDASLTTDGDELNG